MKSSGFKIIATLLAALFLCNAQPLEARKKGYKLKVDKSEKAETAEMVSGSFMVASECTDCNNGYQLSQIVLSGYDKPRNSSNESFFITNNTDRTLTGLNLYIEYVTPDGRQLHKRFYPLRCQIPAGETRRAELKSWDTQRSFVYVKSQDSHRNPGSQFDVIFDPVAYYLRY